MVLVLIFWQNVKTAKFGTMFYRNPKKLWKPINVKRKIRKMFSFEMLEQKKWTIEKQHLQAKIVTRKWSALQAYNIKFIYNFII